MRDIDKTIELPCEHTQIIINGNAPYEEVARMTDALAHLITARANYNMSLRMYNSDSTRHHLNKG